MKNTTAVIRRRCRNPGCNNVVEGRADKLYCTERCQRRAEYKRNRQRARSAPPGPKYAYRVVWMLSTMQYPARRMYERQQNAEQFFHRQLHRADLTWITIERRKVTPWAVVTRWRH